jgi:hypothetical protein
MYYFYEFSKWTQNVGVVAFVRMRVLWKQQILMKLYAVDVPILNVLTEFNYSRITSTYSILHLQLKLNYIFLNLFISQIIDVSQLVAWRPGNRGLFPGESRNISPHHHAQTAFGFLAASYPMGKARGLLTDNSLLSITGVNNEWKNTLFPK